MEQYLSEIQNIIKNLKRLAPQKTISSEKHMESLRFIVKQWKSFSGKQFLKPLLKEDKETINSLTESLWNYSGKEKQNRLKIIKKLHKIYNILYKYLLRETGKEMVIFDPDKPFTAYQILKKLFAKAKKEILIFDGYVEEGTLDILSGMDRNTIVRILTNNTYGKFLRELPRFRKEFPSCEVKKSPIVHDRFFFIDGKCFISGNSLHALGGKKPSHVFEVSKDIANILKNHFENIWNQANKI